MKYRHYDFGLEDQLPADTITPEISLYSFAMFANSVTTVPEIDTFYTRTTNDDYIQTTKSYQRKRARVLRVGLLQHSVPLVKSFLPTNSKHALRNLDQQFKWIDTEYALSFLPNDPVFSFEIDGYVLGFEPTSHLENLQFGLYYPNVAKYPVSSRVFVTVKEPVDDTILNTLSPFIDKYPEDYNGM